MTDDDTPDPRFAGDDWFAVWRSLSTEADPLRIPFDAAWWADYERRVMACPDDAAPQEPAEAPQRAGRRR